MTLLMDGPVSTEAVLKWNTDNVTEWLKTIGLEKYISKFKRNMVTGEILVQLDELLLDDLNITNISDRQMLLQSVAGFTGNVEDCIKTGSSKSSLITSFNEDENVNTRCEPEMEVLKTNENDSEEKTTTIFPAFAELLPTIGEEEEIDEGGSHHSEDPLNVFSTEKHHKDLSQSEHLKPDENEKDGLDNKSSSGHVKKANIDMSNDVGHDTRASSGLEDEEVASRATQIVQVISEENMCLRKQLEKYYQEIKKLKCVDRELRDTQIMYKDLKSAFITREHKEKAMRLRMEAEIAQLQKTNAELTDELKDLQTVLGSESKKDLQELKDEINQRDDEVQQLQKERKISKSSLQNLERILKQKSSEIIILRQQLETSVCNVCGSKQMKEERDNKIEQKETSGDYLEQFHESMMKSSGRYRTRFLNRSNQRFSSKKDELDITTCVPVLVELLKEKDAEIVKLRAEIDQEMSGLSETSGPEWTSSVSGRRLHKYRQSKQRFSDLETEIRSLHVKMAEKDAQIKILQCKYGENLDSSSPLGTPFRVHSFTSQSSISSYQDSGVMTASDGHFDETAYQNAKDDGNPEGYQLRLNKESGFDIETDGRHLDKQEEEETSLSDHCWFV